ncbi:MAG: type II toxin-antitoxin system RelE/ParE family toxin [Vulcanimicrobiaceae bacterium]
MAPKPSKREPESEKPVVYLRRAQRDLKNFPKEVRIIVARALRLAATGGQHPDAKRMQGEFRDVIEIVTKDDPGKRTFRIIYTVKIGEVVYVLHAFCKKSKSGIATPQPDLALIKQRYKDAQQHYKENYEHR